MAAVGLILPSFPSPDPLLPHHKVNILFPATSSGNVDRSEQEPIPPRLDEREHAASPDHYYIMGKGGCHPCPAREASCESMELLSETVQGWAAEPSTTYTEATSPSKF